jgi:glycerol-3-phosphate dehydrogenase
VHGGLRYLKNGQIRLTVESVHERERLVNERRGLVSPLGFLIANFQRDALPAWVFGLGLVAYDLLALKWTHRGYDAYDMLGLCPPLSSEGLVGGFRYFDAQTDDARLVLRVIQEAIQGGGRAINYAPVIQLLHNQSGQVCGIVLQDDSPEGGGRTAEVQASVVISATGAWADNLRSLVGEKKDGLEPLLRKLRGSQLIFPADRLPMTRCQFSHPKMGVRIAFPGGYPVTTDVDHGPNLQVDPAISAGEVEYLLKAAQQIFAAQELTEQDIQGVFSGIRPVINTGQTNPSKESREHVLWNENGLITVAGGKLTTFRLMAQDALRKARQLLPHVPSPRTDEGVFSEIPTSIQYLAHLPPELRLRLLGRHGQNAATLVMAAGQGELNLL